MSLSYMKKSFIFYICLLIFIITHLYILIYLLTEKLARKLYTKIWWEIYSYLLTCHRTQNPHLKYCNIQEGQRRPKLHQLHQSCLHCFDIFYTSLSKLMLSTKWHFISDEFASSAQNVNHILIIVSKLIFIYSLYIRHILHLIPLIHIVRCMVIYKFILLNTYLCWRANPQNCCIVVPRPMLSGNGDLLLTYGWWWWWYY